ncbi:MULTISPECIES: WXG100 family type VII secretion target [Amycolatopsis]|uniref:WXG100 family type VII secretion target n=1 Tax=Amycolatopsis albidoflavus TaxID=102226 RepID=A0ABW5IGN5_9PSEU
MTSPGSGSLAMPGQPVLDNPELDALTFDQLAQLISEVSPDAFYQRAAAFDRAAARLHDVLDQVRRQLRYVQEAWTSKGSEDFDSIANEVVARAQTVLLALENPGYGKVLRQAGDVLAAHQQRLRGLQGQKAQQESAPPAPGAPTPEAAAQMNDQSVKQIMNDLRTAYQDIGKSIAPLPPAVGDDSWTSHVPPPVVNAPPVGVKTADWTGGPAGSQDRPWQLLTTGGYTPHSEGLGTRRGSFSSPVDELQPGAVLGRGQRSADPEPATARPAFRSEPGAPPPVLGQGVVARERTTPIAPLHVGVGVGPVVLGREERPAVVHGVKPAEKRGKSKKDSAGRRAVEGKKDVAAKPGAEVARDVAAKHDVVGVHDAAGVHDVAAKHGTTADFDVAAEHDVAAHAGRPATVSSEGGGASAARLPATIADGVPAHEVAAATVDGTLSVPGGATAALHSGSADPGGAGPSRMAAAMHAPGAAGTYPAELAAAGPYPAVQHGDAPDRDGAGAQSGGMPMSPMMLGGMQGQQQQQNGRMAGVPAEPKPEIWNPPSVLPVVLGRAEPAPQASEAAEKPEPITPESVLAEVDKLLERRKP